MQASVLNLDVHPENFEQVKRGFAQFGINCIRQIGSIDKHPAIGCTKSHLDLVRFARENNEPYVMVFEDDCMPCNSMGYWPDVWNYLSANRRRWDLFYGGATMVHPVRWECGFLHPINRIIECRHALSVHFVIYNNSSFNRALEWFDLPESEEQRPVIDTWLTSIGLRIWTVAPMLAIQRPSFSNNQGRMVDYTDHFERAEAKLNEFVKMRKKAIVYKIFKKYLKRL
jgi:hypothetical protein